ncbi:MULTISPECIES: hypothetical protein [unclassified Afipia]|uniref:hypothetical protein n=1 Tax=unclassified Afipia TaxID=2642050 RepID=UPI0004662821|nr:MULTISPECIES: hypothetical protein [unclassified Afipia]
MPLSKLSAALTAVDWNKNVAAFLSDGAAAKSIAEKNLRIAIWAKQLESSDKGNPALCFIREMQMAGQHVAALVSLALYKPAAASMRTMFETALYYTYFRSHPSELVTLVRSSEYFVDKRELLEYHKRHTPDYPKLQKALGLNSRIEAWYSAVSSVVHGQIPGTWLEHKSLSEIAPIKTTQQLVLMKFREGEEIVHRLLLCTAGKQMWDTFSPPAKQKLLHGLSGKLRTTLALDLA